MAAGRAEASEFGLDKPAAEVTLRLKDGKQLAPARGGKSPTGAWVYAREAQKPAVLALSESVLRDATRPLADFRDRTLLAFEPKSVSAFEVATRAETLAVERAEGRWRLTTPAALAADAQAVDDFLDKLPQQRVHCF